MLLSVSRIFRRMMSFKPTSHFITLPNRPILQENGDISQGPLQLHYWQWKGHEPTILLCHGASFHGRCYDRIINEALSGFHVISIDLRGHGRSQKHPPPYKTRWFGEDLIHFIESLNLSKDNLFGIGHSVGAYALTLAASVAPRQLFQSLLLFDPVIFSESLYGAVNNKYDYIRRRKNQWSSVEDMISYMEKREPFSRWTEDVRRDYCTYALDDNFRLACSPDTEASIYENGVQKEASIYQQVTDSKCINDIPIHIVRASIPRIPGDLEASLTAPDLVKWFKKGRDTQLKDAKHLFPMEQPQVAIDLVKQFVEENKNLRSHL